MLAASQSSRLKGYAPCIPSPLSPRRQDQDILALRQTRCNERPARKRVAISPPQRLLRCKAAAAWRQLSEMPHAPAPHQQQADAEPVMATVKPLAIATQCSRDDGYAVLPMIEDLLSELERGVASELQKTPGEHQLVLQARRVLLMPDVALTALRNFILTLASWCVLSAMGMQGLLYCIVAATRLPSLESKHR
ncbi:hypothetical protein CDD82_4459 [Ophiocordyceps australis]|uniref:Uncharacterized protein n=1 Tax=Ophiocordyceps australis TaxID=1399860 RepID=A0A2C5Z0R7_9HYPO|nr:hypothetical protein CDD82_4459 [Ophiocordyceps australis]